MASLFDSPNDIHWQGSIDSFKRQSTQTLVGKIVDERGDANYTDNLTQKYTVELLGWGTKLYNCKTLINSGGYNGTGDYRSFKLGDLVLVQCKEGQMDEPIIVGSTRLNGNHQKLEQEGQTQKYGEHYVGSRGRVAPSNPPTFHPSRITKLDSDVKIGGVNNVKSEYEDPTELGSLEERLEKQPIPGVVKTITKEGVDVTYAYGGILNMTDGNFVILSSGTTQNKCSKFLKQANRHNKIASHLAKLGQFTSTSTQDLINFTDVAFGDIENIEIEFDKPESLDTPNPFQHFDPNASFSISRDTPLFTFNNAQPIENKENEESLVGDEAFRRSGGQTTEERLLNTDAELEQPNTEGKEARSLFYRYQKHLELAKIAKKQAEECNANGAAYQYAAGLMGNTANNPLTANSDQSPNQAIGNVDPNNYSSRNSNNPKPPTEVKNAHPTNYNQRNHTPKWLVMHHSVGSMESMTNRFQTANQKVSAHYAVGRDGKVVQYVPDNQVAYHVLSQNTGKIGIEIVATKPAHGMTQVQEEALIKLARYILSTYNIPISNVKGHNYFMRQIGEDTECPTWVFPTDESLEQWADKYLKV